MSFFWHRAGTKERRRRRRSTYQSEILCRPIDKEVSQLVVELSNMFELHSDPVLVPEELVPVNESVVLGAERAYELGKLPFRDVANRRTVVLVGRVSLVAVKHVSLIPPCHLSSLSLFLPFDSARSLFSLSCAYALSSDSRRRQAPLLSLLLASLLLLSYFPLLFFPFFSFFGGIWRQKLAGRPIFSREWQGVISAT